MLAAPQHSTAGFCRSVKPTEIAPHGHVLTPGRYVGAELDQLIRTKLKGLGYEF